nr:GvpL/GvpF family gas vesicle protein [uncultured Draconibacterium sp.]
MAKKGIYIYGIIPNFYSAEMFRSLVNTGIYTIAYQNISAIVSDRENVSFDFLNREELGHLLVEHQKTIENLMQKGFNMVIPMHLGTIVNSKEEVFEILSTGYNLIINTLSKIESMVEIDLAVTWGEFSATIKEVADHPDIIALKTEILKKKDPISHTDQVKIGALFEEKLKEKNAAVELEVMNALSALCTDIKIHEVMDDQMITNSAYLLNRNEKEKFEKTLDRLDAEYKGMLNFKMVGPLPCYSFYTLEVKELNPATVSQAQHELGLSEISSEVDVKRAYQEKVKEYHPDVNQDSGSVIHFNRIKNAYQILLEYMEVARLETKEQAIAANRETTNGKLILVKIKE